MSPTVCHRTSDAAVAVIRVRDAAAEADGPDASAYLRKARMPSPRAGETVTAIALSPCSRLAGVGTSSGRVFVMQVFAPDDHPELFVPGAVHDVSSCWQPSPGIHPDV